MPYLLKDVAIVVVDGLSSTPSILRDDKEQNQVLQNFLQQYCVAAKRQLEHVESVERRLTEEEVASLRQVVESLIEVKNRLYE